MTERSSYLEVIRTDATFVLVQQAAAHVLAEREQAYGGVERVLMELIVKEVGKYEVPAFAASHQFAILRLQNQNKSCCVFQKHIA